MADSDDEYVNTVSEDETAPAQTNGYGTRRRASECCISFSSRSEGTMRQEASAPHKEEAQDLTSLQLALPDQSLWHLLVDYKTSPGDLTREWQTAMLRTQVRKASAVNGGRTSSAAGIRSQKAQTAVLRVSSRGSWRPASVRGLRLQSDTETLQPRTNSPPDSFAIPRLCKEASSDTL